MRSVTASRTSPLRKNPFEPISRENQIFHLIKYLSTNDWIMILSNYIRINSNHRRPVFRTVSHTTYAIWSNCSDHVWMFLFFSERNDRGRKLAFSDDDDDRSEKKKWSINRSFGRWSCRNSTLFDHLFFSKIKPFSGCERVFFFLLIIQRHRIPK